MRAGYDMDHCIEWKYRMRANKTRMSVVNQIAGREKETAPEDEIPNSSNTFYFPSGHNWMHLETTERMLQVEQKYLYFSATGN